MKLSFVRTLNPFPFGGQLTRDIHSKKAESLDYDERSGMIIVVERPRLATSTKTRHIGLGNIEFMEPAAAIDVKLPSKS